MTDYKKHLVSIPDDDPDLYEKLSTFYALLVIRLTHHLYPPLQTSGDIAHFILLYEQHFLFCQEFVQTQPKSCNI